MGKEVRGVIVTRAQGTKEEMLISNIKEMLDLPILGVVPEDKLVRHSVQGKDALLHLYPNARAARAYKRLAARLAGIEYDEPGFLARLFGGRR